jgi:hypothetical protein
VTYYGICQVCGHRVTSETGRPAFQVMGFEVPRDQGGTNHIIQRQRVPNRVWHERCLPEARNEGVQEALL